MVERPTSPHASIYRYQYTMVLSFMHRLSGIWMSLGLIALVYWLASAAAGEYAYERASAVFSSWPFRLLLLSWLAAFCYHFANGLRHLAWDAGLGLEKRQARLSARVVVVIAVLAFLALACLLCCPRAGAL